MKSEGPQARTWVSLTLLLVWRTLERMGVLGLCWWNYKVEVMGS